MSYNQMKKIAAQAVKVGQKWTDPQKQSVTFIHTPVATQAAYRPGQRYTQTSVTPTEYPEATGFLVRAEFKESENGQDVIVHGWKFTKEIDKLGDVIAEIVSSQAGIEKLCQGNSEWTVRTAYGLCKVRGVVLNNPMLVFELRGV
jgi:hypothetical protein